jgi:hypothetical protein
MMSFAKDRALIELSKTMTLDQIVKKTGRSPKAILEAARRLLIRIKLATKR